MFIDSFIVYAYFVKRSTGQINTDLVLVVIIEYEIYIYFCHIVKVNHVVAISPSDSI